MLKAVIFDIDGTLLDSVDEHAEAWQKAFERFGHEFPFPEIRYQIGKGGDKLLETFFSPNQIEKQGKTIEEYRAHLFQSQYLSRCKPFPEVPELFRKLKSEGFQIALATSAKKEEAEKYQEMIGISGIADAVTTKDDVENSKPDPDVLQVARRLLGGRNSNECIFIGDTPHDAEAASKDGIRMIGVLCGGFEESDLRKAGAEAIFADPQDLLLRWNPK